MYPVGTKKFTFQVKGFVMLRHVSNGYLSHVLSYFLRNYVLGYYVDRTETKMHMYQ